MRDFHHDNLSHDPIHGYISFSSGAASGAGEVSERQIIDHPWVQRLRYIHQLQTAWLVYPSAEHTRFQHVLGVMHLASRFVAGLYESLKDSCPDVPSRGYVESLLRMAGLLHDVGHGPFGHFFDEHFLSRFGATHESLGAQIIETELGPLLRCIRRNPNSRLEAGETLDPAQIAWLIQRPKTSEPGTGEPNSQPRWLHLLRCLLSGIYTIDNLDFVLRDAYMSGYSQRAYDLDRLLHYSFFTEQGLTIHDRGFPALIRFMSMRAELFRTIYFHRTVRAIDVFLADLFQASSHRIFPGDPRHNLEAYRGLTESSLLVDVARWSASGDEELRRLGDGWQQFLRRDIPWKMVAQRTLVYGAGDAEQKDVLARPDFAEKLLRENLPVSVRNTPLKIDIARHIYRPHTRGPALGQNFLYNSTLRQVRPLTDDQLFSRLPQANRYLRVYALDEAHAADIARALDAAVGGSSDDLTNM